MLPLSPHVYTFSIKAERKREGKRREGKRGRGGRGGKEGGGDWAPEPQPLVVLFLFCTNAERT
jgi:hypothetical protein